MAGETSANVRVSGTIAGITFGGTAATPTFESPIGFQRTMAIGTNIEIDVTVDISELQVIVMEADVDCTLKTNSSGSPTDTISLKANKPLLWVTGWPAATLVLTADVTKFFGTFTAATVVKIAGGQNVTPAV